MGTIREGNGPPLQCSCQENPMVEEPGGLQSMGLLNRTRLSVFTFTFHFSLSCIGEGHGNLLQCSCLKNPRDGGAWWAAVYGVAQSRTWLKRLGSSSSSIHKYLLSCYLNRSNTEGNKAYYFCFWETFLFSVLYPYEPCFFSVIPNFVSFFPKYWSSWDYPSNTSRPCLHYR